MDKDTIIRLAKASFGNPYASYRLGRWDVDFNQVERFAALIAAEEREACAKVCDEIEPKISSSATHECAAAIRARGEKCSESDSECSELRAAADKALLYAAKYADVIQSITDPENQPSQYGTVLLSHHNELRAAAQAVVDWWYAGERIKESGLDRLRKALGCDAPSADGK